MTILSSLKSCLREDLLHDSSRLQLFLALTSPDLPYSFRHLFHTLIIERQQMVIRANPSLCHANLHQIYLSNEYQLLVNVDPPQTECLQRQIDYYLEQVALKHFGCLSQMWAHIELELISQRQCGFSPYTPGITFDDHQYQGQLVEDVALSELVVSSPYREGLYSLSDAICLSCLELFVIEQHWYELLPLLEHSATGCHFILLHTPTPDTQPCLAASAMINRWDEADKWLSFSSFFQNPHWQSLVTTQQLIQLNQLNSFHHMLNQPSSLSDFDNYCTQNVADPESICEILRLTTAGQKMQRLYLLYLAQKRMAHCLFQAGYRCAYTIIENPWLLNFYRQLGEKSYIDTGCCSINDQSSPTFRGMWLVEEFNFQYSSIDFRSYKQMVRNTVNRKEVKDA